LSGRSRSRVTDPDAAHLAVFDAGRPLFPGSAQITLNGLVAGYVEIYSPGFKRTGFQTKPAAITAFRINVYNASILIQKHCLLLFGARIVARVVQAVTAGVYLVFKQNGIPVQKDSPDRGPHLAFMNKSADNFAGTAPHTQGYFRWILPDINAVFVFSHRFSLQNLNPDGHQRQSTANINCFARDIGGCFGHEE
jgi:hypothetical protein